jgi:hypothetical protein
LGGRDCAGFERTELPGTVDEQRIDREDPAVHAVGGDELDQRLDGDQHVCCSDQEQ